MCIQFCFLKPNVTSEHQNCLSEVDVWLSNGSDTQNTKGTQLDLSRFGLLSLLSNSTVIFVLGVPNRGLQWWKSIEIGKGSLSATLEFVGVLPRSLGVGPNRFSPSSLSWVRSFLLEFGSVPSKGSYASLYILRRARCTCRFCSSLWSRCIHRVHVSSATALLVVPLSCGGANNATTAP